MLKYAQPGVRAHRAWHSAGLRTRVRPCPGMLRGSYRDSPRKHGEMCVGIHASSTSRSDACGSCSGSFHGSDLGALGVERGLTGGLAEMYVPWDHLDQLDTSPSARRSQEITSKTIHKATTKRSSRKTPLLMPVPGRRSGSSGQIRIMGIRHRSGADRKAGVRSLMAIRSPRKNTTTLSWDTS